MLIVTNINDMNIGLLVEGVERIVELLIKRLADQKNMGIL